jgi:hypothetical protein
MMHAGSLPERTERVEYPNSTPLTVLRNVRTLKSYGNHHFRPDRRQEPSSPESEIPAHSLAFAPTFSRSLGLRGLGIGVVGGVGARSC